MGEFKDFPEFLELRNYSCDLLVDVCKFINLDLNERTDRGELISIRVIRSLVELVLCNDLADIKRGIRGFSYLSNELNKKKVIDLLRWNHNNQTIITLQDDLDADGDIGMEDLNASSGIKIPDSRTAMESRGAKIVKRLFDLLIIGDEILEIMCLELLGYWTALGDDIAELIVNNASKEGCGNVVEILLE
ncbi:hypothetical protein HK096_007427, partial [Nowakowskiella sp. JEL0078]